MSISDFLTRVSGQPNSDPANPPSSAPTPTGQTLRAVDLARHWNVSRSYISKLRKEKQMPDFATSAEADTWRQLHASPANKRGRPSSPKNDAENNHFSSASETSPIDLQDFVSSDQEFDTLMIRHAEEVPQIAYGLYRRAAEKGDPIIVAQQVKNWGEASKQAAAVRRQFLEIKQRTGELLPIDETMNIVGVTLGGIISGLARLPHRCAKEANPEDPARAQAAIAAAVDRILELAKPAPQQ